MDSFIQTLARLQAQAIYLHRRPSHFSVQIANKIAQCASIAEQGTPLGSKQKIHTQLCSYRDQSSLMAFGRHLTSKGMALQKFKGRLPLKITSASIAQIKAQEFCLNVDKPNCSSYKN